MKWIKNYEVISIEISIDMEMTENPVISIT